MEPEEFLAAQIRHDTKYDILCVDSSRQDLFQPLSAQSIEWIAIGSHSEGDPDPLQTHLLERHAAAHSQIQASFLGHHCWQSIN